MSNLDQNVTFESSKIREMQEDIDRLDARNTYLERKNVELETWIVAFNKPLMDIVRGNIEMFHKNRSD